MSKPANPVNTKAAKGARQQARAAVGAPAKGRPRATQQIPKPDVTEPTAPVKRVAKTVRHKKPELVVMNNEFAYLPPPVPMGVTAEQAELGIRATSTPGVFINAANVLVDEDGVLLDFDGVRGKDKHRFERVQEREVNSPAELLRAIAMDPTVNMGMRMDAAKAAAPYTDRKMGSDVEAGELSLKVQVSRKLTGLTDAELELFEALLLKVQPEELKQLADQSKDAA